MYGILLYGHITIYLFIPLLFPVFDITKKNATINLVHISWCLGAKNVFLVLELLGCRVDIFSALKKAKLFSEGFVLLYTPTSSV